MDLIFLAQTDPSSTPLAIPLTLGPVLFLGGLYITKVQRVRRTPFTGKVAVYVGYVFWIAGLALLLLGLLSVILSQLILPFYKVLLGIILYGWAGAFLFAYVLWFFRPR